MRHKFDNHSGKMPRQPGSFLPNWLVATQNDDDELINFLGDEQDAGADAGRTTPPLVLLVVDDDDDVHHSTRIALDGERVLGRRIELLHAHSAEQAREIVVSTPAITIMLLDVVMETEDAGLRLLSEIREHIDRHDIRVIIRTGQPGYATEAHFENNEVIDGYLLKSRLTRTMLLDALANALAPGRKPDA
jgi:DNA-binding NtrC family response regulator